MEHEENVDPIFDIIDYLVRYAKVNFKCARLGETETKTSDKIRIAFELYTKSPVTFLMQYGKYLAPQHLQYFENVNVGGNDEVAFKECIKQLKVYHSEESRHKRVKNRRYKAMLKLQKDSDYFSEKQMMYRNPLLYEQLVGQYLTDEEVHERDAVDNDNLTFLSMILETVDRNEMRETKNKQIIEENSDITEDTSRESEHVIKNKSNKRWGDFDVPDSRPDVIPEPRAQSMISAPERNMLREEFLQEMYSSFLEGRDVDVDYHSIDNDEQYDDLQQVSQDAEDKYFDSETNEAETLEDHMEYGQKKSVDNIADDPLDVFMQHLNKAHNN